MGPVSDWIPFLNQVCYHFLMIAVDHFTRIAAETLARARRDAGLSLREVARRAGTSHPTLLAYEAGRKCPSVSTYLRVLEACGYAVDFDLKPRIRWQDGIPRGEELQAVLALAEQFPAKVPRRMNHPMFPAPA